MKQRRKHFSVQWAAGGIAVMIAAACIAVTIGQYGITLKEVAATLMPSLFPDVEVSAVMNTVIWNIRIPRIILSLLAGAGLAVSGAAFQGLFANPLATPDTLGVATGASFGAVLGILFGFSSFGIQIMAMLMGIAAVVLAFSISRMKGFSSILMIVLAGMVISSLFSALVSLVKYMADPQDVLPSITYWLMGSFASTTKQTLFLGVPFILGGSLLIFLLRWKLNSMSLNEEEARALGVPVKKIRMLIILAAAMVTASVVSMCGQIGWVGLLIPHIAKMLFGNDNRSVIPASMIFGAVFMLVIDTVARTLTQSEIPVSILTAVVGAPFFIILLRKTGGLGQ